MGRARSYGRGTDSFFSYLLLDSRICKELGLEQLRVGMVELKQLEPGYVSLPSWGFTWGGGVSSCGLPTCASQGFLSQGSFRAFRLLSEWPGIQRQVSQENQEEAVLPFDNLASKVT